MTQLLYAYVSEDLHELFLKNFLPKFPVNFQEKVLRYRRWEDAQLTMTGRLLLKKGLESIQKEYNEKDIVYSEYNKPELKDSNIKFNISHSGLIVVCIITDVNDVGIDIEKIHRINLKDFEPQMSPSEIERIKNATDDQLAFFNYWTQKEAVIKSNGKGLLIPLNAFEVIDNQTEILDENFYLREIKIDDEYKCNIAFKDAEFTNEITPERIYFLEKREISTNYIGKVS